MLELKILVIDSSQPPAIMLLWLIEPKIDWNRLLRTIESKNLVTIMIMNNGLPGIMQLSQNRFRNRAICMLGTQIRGVRAALAFIIKYRGLQLEKQLLLVTQ